MEGWDPIKQCNPATFLCLSQAKTWISNVICYVMKKKIPSITTNQTITELNEHRKTMTYDIVNPSPVLEQAQKMWLS